MRGVFLAWRVGELVAEQLRPVARPRLYEVIVEQLCSYMSDNDLSEGDHSVTGCGMVVVQGDNLSISVRCWIASE